jgi:transcriptional regulator with XRE-family HTH domain
MFDEMTFGERLRYIRKKRRITQDKLAKKIGVSRQTVFEYEANMMEPRWFTFMCIADALGVSMDFLARGDLSEI